MGMPRLGQHQGRLSLSFQCAGERGRNIKGTFSATRDRLRSSDGPILMLHDTTEFNYHREICRRSGFFTRIR